jgi:glycosyltransferase involved in cell wall biosynthesis
MKNEQPEYTILWIRAAVMTTSTDPARSFAAHLSRRIAGDYLAAWVVDDRAAAERMLPQLSLFFGRFRFHYILRRKWPSPLRQMAEFAFYITRGFRLLRQEKHDVIVAYGPFTTGLAGYVLSRITGTPLILEIPGNPWRSLLVEGGGKSTLKHVVGLRLARYLIRHADHVRLLYPSQIPDGLRQGPISVFHNFVPVSVLPRGTARNAESPYIILIGAPLYLKGADLLIEAFRRVAPEFPEWSLKVVGYSGDYAPFQRLAGANPRIELLGPVPHPEALQLLRDASLLVHPSRTEAMGRVLLEAMASGTPILASSADGIPYYVKNHQVGLLFESENTDDLEEKLRYMLTHRDQAWRLADEAFRYVHADLSEPRYVDKFCEMLGAVTAVQPRR